MRKFFINSFIFLALILTACGASNTTQTDTSTPLPLAMQLVVGTFKLEETKNAVTAQEAAKLLPLWQVYKDLSISSSAAPQEVQALAEQIQSTMTPEQVQAITDMNLTRRDIFDIMQKMGIENSRPNAYGTPRANGGQGGGFPGGGPGGIPGGGGEQGGQNLSPQQIATLQARRAQNGGSGGQQSSTIPPALYDALIKLLQGKN